MIRISITKSSFQYTPAYVYCITQQIKLDSTYWKSVNYVLDSLSLQKVPAIELIPLDSSLI
jgi:hypothetical protein